MEKSKQSLYQDVNPSAPPVQSSIHQQNFVHQSMYSATDHGNPHQIGIKSNHQLEVVRHEPVPPISTTHSAIPPYQEQNERYCRKLHRHRRQTGSITGGLFLMLVSGIHIGWGIWRTGTWPITTNMSLLIFSIMAWPFGAIFGSFIGSALITVLRKNIIYFLTAAVMIIGNVLHIIWDRNYAAIVIGRLLISLAHGMVFVAIITQAGENASRNMRGTVVSTIHCMIHTAIYITAHVNVEVNVNADFSAERILAIISLIFILASIICTLTLTVETVPFLLRKNQPNMATETLKHLRDVQQIEAPQITYEMEELTLVVAQDEQHNENPFTNGNIKPLMQMLVFRLMAALTNNFLLNFVLIRFCQLILSNPRYAPLLVVGPRLAFCVLQILYADVIGRKIQLFISASLAGLLLIGLGIVLNTINTSLSYYIPSIFCIHFFLLCSMGFQQMADVYLSEAFSTAKKPWSLSFVLGLENVFQIFMTGMAFTTLTAAGIYTLLFISGILVFCMAIILVITLPETKGKSLKQARDLLRKEQVFHFLDIASPYA